MPLPALIAVKSAEIAIFDRRVENSNTFLQNVLGGCGVFFLSHRPCENSNQGLTRMALLL